MRKYQDNSIAPIVAWDFDGTIGVGANYPECGALRPYSKEVINFLIAIGVKVVIWTSRDVAVNQDDYKVYDDLTPMINFLNTYGVQYSAINKSVQFAPFYYNTRKIYAHKYIDDRGYGWVESPCAMIYVLEDILTTLLDMPVEMADQVCAMVSKGEVTDEYIERFKQYVADFWV